MREATRLSSRQFALTIIAGRAGMERQRCSRGGLEIDPWRGAGTRRKIGVEEPVDEVLVEVGPADHHEVDAERMNGLLLPRIDACRDQRSPQERTALPQRF